LSAKIAAGRGLSGRQRSLLLWCARLALLAYVCQLAAVDHWRADVHDVVGIEGSAAHSAHCHGGPDGCSDGGGGFAVALESPPPVPAPPLPLLSSLPSVQPSLNGAFIAAPDEPPRST
jgi:hypothetical protein